ncbi:MAG TPA: TetR family transcriptional regulator [Candidatus Binataceae bacterium]|nr:TetR family transcriptional regulator [Candidatus Binataceae bacterium]
MDEISDLENGETTTLTKGDASATRARILAAAQEMFSKRGYSESGMRDIADMLGLSSTILFRYFGTKAGLFEAALRDALGIERKFPPRSQFGQFIADWVANPNLDMSPHAMTVLATGHEEARAIAARVLQELTLTPIAEWLGPPDAEARARQIIALCSGFALYTFQLNVSPGPREVDAGMKAWLARSVQSIVDR